MGLVSALCKLAIFLVVGVSVVGATGHNATDDMIIGYTGALIDDSSTQVKSNVSVDSDNRTVSIEVYINESEPLSMGIISHVLLIYGLVLDDVYAKFPDQIDFTYVEIYAETPDHTTLRYLGMCQLDRTL